MGKKTHAQQEIVPFIYIYIKFNSWRGRDIWILDVFVANTKRCKLVELQYSQFIINIFLFMLGSNSKISVWALNGSQKNV